MKINNNGMVDGYVLYYRRNGEKRSLLLPSMRAVKRQQKVLRDTHKKFLGYRKITLKEVGSNANW